MADLTGGQRGRPRPPLTKRMRRGHWVALDCVTGAVAALCTVMLAMGSVRAQAGPGVAHSPVRTLLGPFPGKLGLTLLFAAAVFVPVGFRRARPVPAFGTLVMVAVVMDMMLGGRHVALVVLLSAAYVLYTVTVETSRRTGAAALGLGLAVALAICLGGYAQAGVFDGAALPVGFVLLTGWMLGHAVRQRRLYADALREQAASKAVTEERLRIARELHDVVAHSMSVIAVQAGFGQYVIDANPSGARDALGAIQATSRDALEEMRRMLGVLRHQDAEAASRGRSSAALSSQAPAPLAPAPGLAGLDRLVERTTGTGVRVSLEQSGAVRPVPAAVDLSAYRILQEALTNVVRHAGAGASCVVSLRYHAETLIVEVIDDGGPRSAPGETTPVSGGHGIIGMRERAALCGGSLEAGPVPSGGFRVTATLPLHGAAPSPAQAPPAVSITEGRPGAVRSSVMDKGIG